MAASILDLLNVPHDLTLEFLLTFARFEFALKIAGYALGSAFREDSLRFTTQEPRLGSRRRFANPTCPVCTHHVSCILNNLTRCQLH
jgi:hypothetical protein